MRVTGVLPAALIFATASPTAVADTYGVDSVHSSVIFRIKHLSASYFYGRFNDVSGNISFNEGDPSKSSFDVQVKADSVDTKNGGRDKHLKSPDFFNVKQYPTITFKSKQVKKTGDQQYEVTGDFTLHGVTKPLTVKVEHTGTGKGMKGEQRAGFETTFTIKRSEFEMSFMLDGLGDDVQITVSLEGVKK
jgi:polyisoprenoid-binding protein YceI